MHTFGVMVAAATVFAAATGWQAVEPAAAGAVEVVGEQLRFTAHDGVGNRLEIMSLGPGKIRLQEHTGPIEPVSQECVADPTATGPWTVTCDVTAVSTYLLDGGDKEDVLLVRDPMSVRLAGGSGHDTLTGNGADDVLDGGTGDDVLDGGGGDDVLIGGPGADVINGAAGVDTAGYARHVLGVTADPDGQHGDDGAAGERDTIGRSVENLTGGAGDDLLVGSVAPNILFGGAGVDTLVGGAGFDHLDGGTGPATGHERDTCHPGPDGGTTRHCEVVR